MCPEKCTCDDVNLIVTCIKAGLEVMPNTLNPRLRTIIYKYNNFPTVDVSLRYDKEFFVHIAIMFHKKRTEEEISSITFIFHQKSFETFSHFHINIFRFFFPNCDVFLRPFWEVKVWMDNIFNIIFHSKNIHFSRI